VAGPRHRLRENAEVPRRGERFMWILLAVVCGTLTVVALALVLWQYRGDQRREYCFEREGRTGDGAAECQMEGDFFG